MIDSVEMDDFLDGFDVIRGVLDDDLQGVKNGFLRLEKNLDRDFARSCFKLSNNRLEYYEYLAENNKYKYLVDVLKFHKNSYNLYEVAYEIVKNDIKLDKVYYTTYDSNADFRKLLNIIHYIALGVFLTTMSLSDKNFEYLKERGFYL